MKWIEMAECAGLAKLMEGSSSGEGWHITHILPHHFVQCHELAWLVFAQYRDTEQTSWTHITGTEALAWRLKQVEGANA